MDKTRDKKPVTAHNSPRWSLNVPNWSPLWTAVTINGNLFLEIE